MADGDDGHEALEDLGLTKSLTRRDVIRRGLGGFLIVYGGALPKVAAAGVPKYSTSSSRTR